MSKNSIENITKYEMVDKKIFDKYETLLKKWQKAINLVSPKTLNELWERHFLDSLYLYDFIKGKENIIDIGSGAGFPAMVLAVAGKDEKDFPKITLVEADERKSFFLNEIKRAYAIDDTRVEIKNQRIENLQNQAYSNPILNDIQLCNVSEWDCIIGRAFAPLYKFIDLCKNIITKQTEMYLLKGDNINEEIIDAKKNWEFDYTIYKKKNGVIVKIWNIKRLK